MTEVSPEEESSLGRVDLDVELSESVDSKLVGGSEPGDVRWEVDSIQPGPVLVTAVKSHCCQGINFRF